MYTRLIICKLPQTPEAMICFILFLYQLLAQLQEVRAVFIIDNVSKVACRWWYSIQVKKLLQKFYPGYNVVVQFYPWFNFYFLLFHIHYHILT